MVANKSQRLLGSVCSFLDASWWLLSLGGSSDVPKVCTLRTPWQERPHEVRRTQGAVGLPFRRVVCTVLRTLIEPPNITGDPHRRPHSEHPAELLLQQAHCQWATNPPPPPKGLHFLVTPNLPETPSMSTCGHKWPLCGRSWTHSPPVISGDTTAQCPAMAAYDAR